MLNKLNSLRTASVSEEGFTLIELIIVVVIIGILAAIAIPMFLNQQKGAIQAGVKSDVRNANTAIATALVKTPTAAEVKGDVTATTSEVNVGAVGGTTYAADVKVSDAKTTLEVDGKWDGYTIVGKNADAGKAAGTPYTYTFNSATGKSVSAND